MAGTRRRLERLERVLKPEHVLIVDWCGESFVCNGKELTPGEYNQLRLLPNVTVVHFREKKVRNGKE